MKIKDIKAGGWVRFNYDDGEMQTVEIAKVKEFHYDKSCTNGYEFIFENRRYGELFERKDFKYADDVTDLIKNTERIIEIRGSCLVCNALSKDEFIKKYGAK